MADEYTNKIENARKSGGIVTADTFKNADARAALQRLAKADTERGMSTMQLAEREQARRAGTLAKPPAFKKGGMVKKTGMAKVHKGERVLTSKQAKHR